MCPPMDTSTRLSTGHRSSYATCHFFIIAWMTLRGIRGTSCLDHLRHWAVHTLLIASSLFWYMRPCLTYTRLIDRTLPILTSASVGVHAQPQVNNKVEGMASCVMMRHLTQPPNCPAEVMIALALLCNHHYISQLSTVEPPSTLEHYKGTTEIKEMADLCVCVCVSKGCYLFPKSDLAFRGCVRTTRLDIFV